MVSSKKKNKKDNGNINLSSEQKHNEDKLPEYKNIHPDVLALEPEHPWSVYSVKKYIKIQKQVLKEHKNAHRRNQKFAEAKYLSTKAYISNMENYLKTGVWTDFFWGKERENKAYIVCKTRAYYHSGPNKGFVKRTHGVFYPDLGFIYTSDMGII